jgi:hypothetical protein
MARAGSMGIALDLFEIGVVMKKNLFSLLAALGMFAVLILPVSAEMSFSTGSSWMSNRGKTVNIEMTFTCEFAGGYEIYGSLVQNSGRLQNYAPSSDASGYCEEGEQVTALVEFPSGRNLAFKPGPAQVDAALYLYNQYTNQEDSGFLNTIVRLKK